MPYDGEVIATNPAATTSQSLSLWIRMPDGGVLSLPSVVGARLIDALVGFGIPVRGACEIQAEGGAWCALINRPWTDRLPAPAHEERALLAAQKGRDGTSRILSHIVLTPDLDGLELELPWDALIPQTYWVAG